MGIVLYLDPISNKSTHPQIQTRVAELELILCGRSDSWQIWGGLELLKLFSISSKPALRFPSQQLSVDVNLQLVDFKAAWFVFSQVV